MLEIDGISKSFFRKKALSDVSFKVKEGEILGLLGPNGAGKTTLIRVINRIIPADKGYVTFRGKLIQQEGLKNIGYLPEERGLYRSMTVEGQIIFLARLRGLKLNEAKEQMNFWLEKFEISGWKKKRIEELSKGMAQKIQFICAIIHDPDLIILDEPFSGFDPLNIGLIRNEIKTFREKGKTVILSTHSMRSVEEICDSVVLINNGEKILEGKVRELRDTYKKGLYAISFHGNMIAFATALWAGYEIVDKQTHSDEHFTVYLKMRRDNEINDLLNAVMHQVKITAVEEVLPGMEDIFLEEVNKTLNPKNE
ncbi:MAG: ATP-binding cassette domain-containing protein [Brumimicrobium sp.]|nr:ATP-binding cassette domain-containing protein [Brumimicrobium sp.]